MADRVQLRMEQMVPEFVDFIAQGAFNVAEVRKLVAKRRNFEYRIASRTPKLRDFLEYIKAEIALDCLHRHRRVERNLDTSKEHFVGFIRVRTIFQRALLRFPQDKKLWLQYIDFCLQSGSAGLTMGAILKALSFHPRDADLWLLAAEREIKLGHFQSARTLLLRGIRASNQDSLQLWKQYFKFECLVAYKLAQAKLTETENASGDPTAVSISCKAAAVVAAHVLGAKTAPGGSEVNATTIGATGDGVFGKEPVKADIFLTYCLQVLTDISMSTVSRNLTGLPEIADMLGHHMEARRFSQPAFMAYGWMLKSLQKTASGDPPGFSLKLMLTELRKSENALTGGKAADGGARLTRGHFAALHAVAFQILWTVTDPLWQDLEQQAKFASAGSGMPEFDNAAGDSEHAAAEGSLGELLTLDASGSATSEDQPQLAGEVVHSEVDELSEDQQRGLVATLSESPATDFAEVGDQKQEGSLLKQILREVLPDGARFLTDCEPRFLESCLLATPSNDTGRSEAGERQLAAAVAGRRAMASCLLDEECVAAVAKFLRSKEAKRHVGAAQLAERVFERLNAGRSGGSDAPAAKRQKCC